MDHFTKVLLRVLMLRMRKSLSPEIAKTQFGFVRDNGTRNAIFTLSMLIERCTVVSAYSPTPWETEKVGL